MFKIKFPAKQKNPHITLHGKEIDVNELLDGNLTIDFWKNIRANSDGFEALYPKLNNEALIYAVKHNLDNCSRKESTTYDGTLQNILVPLLLERLNR